MLCCKSGKKEGNLKCLHQVNSVFHLLCNKKSGISIWHLFVLHNFQFYVLLFQIFSAVIFNLPGQTKATRSKAVKNVRQHACSVLVKICKQYQKLVFVSINLMQSDTYSLNFIVSYVNFKCFWQLLLVDHCPLGFFQLYFTSRVHVVYLPDCVYVFSACIWWVG